MPGPIGTPARRRTWPVLVVGLLVIGGAAIWITRNQGASAPTPDDRSDESFRSLTPPVVVFDGSTGAGTAVEMPVGTLVVGSVDDGLVGLTLVASGAPVAGELLVGPCGDASVTSSILVDRATETIGQVLVPPGPDGTVCMTTPMPVDLVVSATSTVRRGTVVPFGDPVRVVDTTAAGVTEDGRFESIGVRPDSSTLRLPIEERFSGVEEAGALVVGVQAVGPLDAGAATVFAPGALPSEPVAYAVGSASAGVHLVPLGPGGELCISTTGRTDLVVDLLALVPLDESPRLVADTAASCPDQTVFPGRRLVAMYGTQRTPRLGVLGEQDPTAAAQRLETIAAPWRTDDSVVIPAFELIATLATETPEDRGVYNLRSSPEFVREYLDVARRHGFQLILDLQPGQSDFLTEAQYYDEFLRQPDVGLALDPEWRTPPPARPQGGLVGTVDAAEVNQVVDYLARIVAEEDLPQKVLVVHQFTPDMVTNRNEIVERPGVALVLHMDGFGSRADKVESYEVVKAGPPWTMGLKLFYDEDVDLLGPDDVLVGGSFDPVPDVVTYQ